MVDKIHEYWNSVRGKAMKHPDLNLDSLEISTMMDYIEDGQNILDVGCGSGHFDLLMARNFNVDVTGIDYSDSMIEEAKKNLEKETLRGRARFSKGNALDLSRFDDNIFDVVVSKRCLINLMDWETKEKALDEIYRVLRKGGVYLFMEATKDGLKALNELRIYFGLKEIEVVWHNDNFTVKDMMDYIENKFKLRKAKNFGIYYLITRVVHPALVYPDEPDPSARINEIARKLQKLLPDRYFQSPHLFMVLEKI